MTPRKKWRPSQQAVEAAIEAYQWVHKMTNTSDFDTLKRVAMRHALSAAIQTDHREGQP